MSWILIISLIFFGLLAVVLDFLLIPGSLVAILGALMEIAGVSLAFANGGLAGALTLGITLVISISVIVLILNSKTWKKCALDTAIESKANEFDTQKVHVGAEGMTLSRLAPSGKANFNGETVEVASEYGLIDENQEVIVVKVQGNKIFVKLK